MSKAQYLLDNSYQQAGLRLEAISALFDETTFRHMRTLGLSSGWRCWEIGAGGASVPTFLGQAVGEGGSVLATDIDVTWAQASASANVTVIQHDVVNDDPPEGTFDLIHARLVLVHLPQRQMVLRKLVNALRPGGWLLIEDADPALQPLACIDESGAEQSLANKIRHGFRKLLKDRGVDLAYGRTLPRVLRDTGLHNVMADCFFPLARPECNFLEVATIELLRDKLIAQNLATETEIDANLANLRSGNLDVATAPMISAWGQRAD